MGTEPIYTTMIAIVLSVLVVFSSLFIGQQITEASGESSYEKFSEMIDTVSQAKENEPLQRPLPMQDNYLYGFNLGTDGINTGRQAVKMPKTPACSTGTCLCLCDEACKTPEKAFCKNIDGINNFYARSEFKGSNSGQQTGDYYTVAIHDNRITCFSLEKKAGNLFFDECA